MSVVSVNLIIMQVGYTTAFICGTVQKQGKSDEPTMVPPTRPRSARTSFPLMKSKVSSVRRCLLLAGAGVCRGPVLCRAVLFWEHDVTTHPPLRHAAAAAAARHVLSCAGSAAAD